MKRRTLLAGAAALAARPAFAQAQAPEKTKVVFWHAMTAALGEEVNRIATAFNATQDAVEIEPVFKGSYPDTLTAAIAAFARRPGAASGADVRGRHRHDARRRARR